MFNLIIHYNQARESKARDRRNKFTSAIDERHNKIKNLRETVAQKTLLRNTLITLHYGSLYDE
jgi:hypothetical protein